MSNENPSIPSEYTVPPEREGERLDQWISEILGDLSSRSAVQKWIRSGHLAIIKENEAEPVPVKANHRIKTGEVFKLIIPEAVESHLQPLDLKLKVLYEDDDLAVIHKPAGLAVHPGKGDTSTTIVNGLLFLWKGLSQGSDALRPGIVHRLDKPTEGLLVIAKSDFAHRKLVKQFQDRTVEKEYAAWLLSSPAEGEGTVDLPIKRHPHERTKMRIDATGRNAVTHYKITKLIKSRRGRKYAFAEIKIDTGRTHQIRVHFANMGSPVAGDGLYSRSAKEFEKFGLLLFARKLSFQHPRTGETLKFELPLPERFLEFERKCEFF
jgi:23S rRNA pseudouridine1911/1915/1917 synthase